MCTVHTCSGISDDKHRVSDVEELLQLYHLQHKQFLWLQALCLHGEGVCVCEQECS